MKTQVIPAQITTVEDKIIGNLNLLQIVILLLSVFLSTIIFACIPPVMMVRTGKAVLMLFCLVGCGILSIRIKGKLVFQWIVVLAKFNLRPKFYVFDKNDKSLRQIDRDEGVSKRKEMAKKSTKNDRFVYTDVNVSDLLRLEDLVKNNGLDIIFKTNAKGGLNVALEKIGK